MAAQNDRYRDCGAARGFTLIEVLIVIAIIGIIAALGYPSYGKYVKESRRTDGRLALLNAVQSMERCKTARFSYANCTLPLAQAQSPEKYYAVAIVSSDLSATSFTISATAQNKQEGDTSCKILTIDELGERAPAACW